MELPLGNAPGKKKLGTSFHAILGLLRRYWYLFLIFLSASIAIAFWVNRNTRPVYLVRTSLLVKETKNVTNNPQNLLYGEGEEVKSSKNNIQEEIALLESYQFIRRTVDSLHLDVGYFGKGRFLEYEMYHNAPFQVQFPERSLISKTYGSRFRIMFTDKDHFHMQPVEGGNLSSQDQEYETGKNININGCPIQVSLTENMSLSRDIGREFSFTVYDPEQLSWEFKNNLNIQSNGPDASIIRIYLAASVPAKGIDFLNEYTSQYLHFKYEEKIRAVSQSLAFIDNQLGLISDSLGSTESNLEQFKISNNFSDASKMTDRSMTEISDLDRTRATLMINEKYYTSVLAALNDSRQPSKIIAPSSVGISDEATGSLIQTLTNLQVEREGFAGLDKNPLARDLDQRITALKNTLKENIGNILKNNKVQLDMASARAGLHQSVIGQIPKSERKFVDINRANNLNEQIYLFLSQKKLEAGIMKAATTVENKVIENAILDSSVPLKPKKKNNYALAILIGLALPSALIWLKGLFNTRVLEAEELQGLHHLPQIGTIFYDPLPSAPVINAGSRTATSESIRILRSRLVSMEGSGPKAFLISSIDSGEGKTFCALNIATAFALVKKKTILVNLDLRARNKIFPELENGLGAGAFLDDLITLREIIFPTETPLLDYIPAGDCPQHCSELFRDDKIIELITTLKRKYDYVIIDSSPMGKIADPLIVARYTDLNLVIVRANYTSREQLQTLDQIFANGDLAHAGFVFNGQRLSKKDRSNYYQSSPGRRSKTDPAII